MLGNGVYIFNGNIKIFREFLILIFKCFISENKVEVIVDEGGREIYGIE